MKTMMKGMWYWKMATLRCLVYMCMVGAGTWQTLTQDITGERWSQLSNFDRGNVFIGVGMGILGVLLAFLDQTMGLLQQKKNGETKPQEPKA